MSSPRQKEGCGWRALRLTAHFVKNVISTAVNIVPYAVVSLARFEDSKWVASINKFDPSAQCSMSMFSFSCQDTSMRGAVDWDGADAQARVHSDVLSTAFTPVLIATAATTGVFAVYRTCATPGLTPKGIIATLKSLQSIVWAMAVFAMAREVFLHTHRGDDPYVSFVEVNDASQDRFFAGLLPAALLYSVYNLLKYGLEWFKSSLSPAAQRAVSSLSAETPFVEKGICNYAKQVVATDTVKKAVIFATIFWRINEYKFAESMSSKYSVFCSVASPTGLDCVPPAFPTRDLYVNGLASTFQDTLLMGVPVAWSLSFVIPKAYNAYKTYHADVADDKLIPARLRDSKKQECQFILKSALFNGVLGASSVMLLYYLVRLCLAMPLVETDVLRANQEIDDSISPKARLYLTLAAALLLGLHGVYKAVVAIDPQCGSRTVRRAARAPQPDLSSKLLASPVVDTASATLYGATHSLFAAGSSQAGSAPGVHVASAVV